MGHPFRVGRLFGIELRVDPSWVFIFALVSWSLTSLFGTWHPEWGVATRLVVAITAALMFFASVLFHELAHALVARGYGIPVRNITLHLFGGVANIEKEPPSPSAEFFIAVVGPIASVALGLAMVLASAAVIHLRAHDVGEAADAVSRLGPASTALVWLGPVNITVGVFNLIPGFPLDGGRILRSLVWKWTGSLQRATRAASSAGQAVGWIFVTMGVAMALGYRIPFFGRGFGSGLWLGMIGLFLRNAAIAHLQGAAIDEALLGVKVSDVMRTQGPTIDASVSVREAVERWFMRRDELAFPVMSDGVFAGVIAVDDVRKASPAAAERVRDLMTSADRVVVVRPDEELAVALRKLASSELEQVPVLERGLLVGMLYERDVARWLELRSRVAPRFTSRPRHA